MKHIRLFDKKDGLMQDVTTNPSADYPVIALCKNEDELSFWNTPIIKAKYNITSDDVKSCIQSDYNIKSLTIDGELKFKKDTWVKYEYQLTQDDFKNSNSIVYTKIYIKLNSGCRNVYLKSNEKATQFLLIYPASGNYALNNIEVNLINIDETKESLFIKQIDEYTYDLTNFYLHYDKTIYNETKNLVGIFLVGSEGNVLTQNLEFECFDVISEQIEHNVTKENAFNTDICFGPIVDISGDINVKDYVYPSFVVNGEMYPNEPIPIKDAIKHGLASLSNNILHVDLSGEFGSEFGLLYVILDKSYESNENMEGIAEFVKNCTIKGKKYIAYTPILSVGEHDIEVELLQQNYMPFFETRALVDLDMSHVNGKYIHINNLCNEANKLKHVRLPNNLSSIGSSTFNGCSGLTSVTIPDSVTSIGSSAFTNCTSLTSIPIPDSVTSIGENAFSGCYIKRDKFINNSSLSGYPWGATLCDIIQDDGLYVNGTNVVYCGKNATNVTIPNSVTAIGSSAFTNCTSLTSIVIPDSVTSIGKDAFYNCTSLTSVTIPDSVTSIGKEAFRYCSSLTSVTIPDSVTTIGNAAFYNCTSLTSVTIPDSVTSISDNAFENCSSLTSVTIGSGVTRIEYNAFNNCGMLTSVTIGSGVAYIGYSAFQGCSSLTSITIPSSVTSISYGAFQGCYFDSKTFINNSSLKYSNDWCANICDVIQEDGLCISGTTAVKCRKNATNVIIPDSVTTIAESSFIDCSSLTSVTIGSGVASISNNAFRGCSSLSSVTIGSSVTSICVYAFLNCTSLTSIVIPDSVTSIGSNAFTNCSGLTSVTIGRSVTSIGEDAFSHCSGLTSVIIPDSVTSIGNEAFYVCRGLTSVTIGSGVTSVGNNAFSHCSGLTSVTCYATTAPALSGSNVFYNLPTNGTLYVPNGSDYSSWLRNLPSGWTIEYI